MLFLRFSPVVLVIGVPLFLGAGRLDLPALWAYPLLVWLFGGTLYTHLARRSPELVAERLGPPSDRDRATRRITLPLLMAHLVTAGIDVGRTGWSHVPLWAQVAGAACFAAGIGLAAWTLLSNPYASSAVRIQQEREQRVVSTGPYALVRHPMYLGVLLCVLGSGPALGSWWATVWLLPVIGVFVRRTLIEDRMLHRELEGYAEYARRVRWRALPGVF